MEKILAHFYDPDLAWSKPDLLDTIKSVNTSIQMCREDINRLVTQARQEGHTWKQIGDALGITRQAAHQRYGESKQ